MATVIPPPYVITETDKRGLIAVITAVTLSFVWVCFLVRMWLRLKPHEWKLDDYVLFAATILDTVLAGLVFSVVDAGLGKAQESLDDHQLRKIAKGDYSIQMVYIFTLLLSKCAVLFLYLRLSPRKGHTLASWTTMGVSVLWAIISIILTAVPCDPYQLWSQGPEQCQSRTAKWQTIAIFDILTEAALFGISIYLVARLHMKAKSKLLVIGAFSFRVPVIVASALRLIYLQRAFDSPDRTLPAAYYIVCTQTQLGYAIMSSTFAGLGPFLRPFSQTSSNYYAGDSHIPSSNLKSHPGTHSETHPPGGGPPGADYEMARLNPRQSNPGLAYEPFAEEPPNRHPSAPLRLRPETDLVRHDNAVRGGNPSMDTTEDSVGRLSDDSQKWIITKKTEFTVEMDRASLMSGRQEWRQTSVGGGVVGAEAESAYADLQKAYNHTQRHIQSQSQMSVPVFQTRGPVGMARGDGEG